MLHNVCVGVVCVGIVVRVCVCGVCSCVLYLSGLCVLVVLLFLHPLNMLSHSPIATLCTTSHSPFAMGKKYKIVLRLLDFAKF